MLKPKVGISACLLGRRVRYDGRDKFDPLPAEVLAGRIEWVPVCPEVESGLPVPREPIQLEGDPAAPELRGVRSHAELTGMMCAFCERRAAELDGLSGFVFKSRSPSCGLAVPVYGADGAQMSPEDTEKVVGYIEKISDYLSVGGDEKSGLILPVPKKLDEDYIEELSRLRLSPEAVKKCGANLKLVYTPVHGSGYVPVTIVLEKLGINVTVVEEQTTKDTEFSTVKVPNPEFKETLSMGIALANKIHADVVFGTDPDSDRLGVAVKDDSGEFVALSGNQVGILLLDYILTRLEEENAMPANAAVVKSFVTTGMAKAICDDFGVTLFETPVGFKFIGEKIKQWETDGKYVYVFGFEESCGYLRGTHARDKDAVVASMLCAEMVCYYTYVGKTLYSRLQEIYTKYGYVLDKNISVQYSGLNAMKEMNAVVDALKRMKTQTLGALKVEAFRDYSAAKRVSYLTGETEEMDIPKCNCVYYELEGGSFVCVRPSGTEPKLKIYYSLRDKCEAAANEALIGLQAAVNELLEKAKK